MEELVKQVSANTGISEDQAREAVKTVLNFVKHRLPAQLADHVDNVVGEGADAVGDLGDIASDLASKVGGGILK